MRTFLALLISICTALWIYGSIRVYKCNIDATCNFIQNNSIIEIIIMLLGTFIFGYLFGNILSGLRTKKYIKKSELDNINSSYTQSKKYGFYKEDFNIDKEKSDNIKHLYGEDSSRQILEEYDSEQNKEVVKTTASPKVDNSKIVPKNNFFTSFLDDIQFKDEDVNLEKEVQKDNPSRQKEGSKANDDDIDLQIKNHTAMKNIETNEAEAVYTHSKKSGKDSLTQIEGIGPKIEKLLNSEKIFTFSDLAKSDAFHLSAILSNAGTRFQMHNPKTWPKQAELAREGKWKELKSYQKRLDGGKE